MRCDEIGDGYGDGDRDGYGDGYGNGYKNSPSNYAHLPLPLQLHSPYYFILTASYSPNTDSNAQHHHVHNAFYNTHDNHLGYNAHNDADKHGLNHAQAATALSPL